MTEQGTLGSYLRALREERKGSLGEMARATRVSVSHLEALEADRIPELPAPVFVKGFIRAYCHFLGEPPDEALDRYRAVLGASRASERAAPSVRPAPSWSASPIFISLALLVVFGGGLLALTLGVTQRPAPAVAPMAPVVKVEPAATPPVPTSPAPDSAGVQRLMVKAIELTWLRIQTDDGTAA